MAACAAAMPVLAEWIRTAFSVDSQAPTEKQAGLYLRQCGQAKRLRDWPNGRVRSELPDFPAASEEFVPAAPQSASAALPQKVPINETTRPRGRKLLPRGRVVESCEKVADLTAPGAAGPAAPLRPCRWPNWSPGARRCASGPPAPRCPAAPAPAGGPAGCFPA